MKWMSVYIAAAALAACILPETYAQQFLNRYNIFACLIVVILAFDVGRTSEENVELLKVYGYLHIHSWWSRFRFYVYGTLSLLSIFLLLEFKGRESFIWVAGGLIALLAWWAYYNRRVRRAWSSSAIKVNVGFRGNRE
jgi:uncharacterized membrane protein YraQ (UPF0718 family)